MDLRERRAADNENLFRRINERVDELSPGDDLPPIVCECADEHCVERLAVERGDYERVRAHAAWFFVAPGHDLRDVESVIEEGRGWLVVAKRGDAGRVARDDDPRSE